MAREITQPVGSKKAFTQSDEASLLSQAAFLLLLGAQLRGDVPLLIAEAGKSRDLFEAIPEDDLKAVDVPLLPILPGKLEVQPIQFRLSRRYGKDLFDKRDPAFLTDVFSDLVERLHSEPTHQTAVELIEACLVHPNQLVRIAAAGASLDLTTDVLRLYPILGEGVRSSDELIRELAATMLAQREPEHERLKPLLQRQARAAGGAATHTTLLVHGTWARNNAWWQPGGDFHSYLAGVLPSLPRTPPWSAPYGAADRFDWTGGYSDSARALAAQDLAAWVNTHGAQGLDLFAHSHGGSVAMQASHLGTQVRELVLLSCPVHPHKYMPDFTRVTQVVSVRVHLDLVIMADRGGQRFRHPNIQEHVLPVWFDHSATHDPSVWASQAVPSLL